MMMKRLITTLSLFCALSASAGDLLDHYAALELEPSASTHEIKRAYTRLSWKYSYLRGLVSRESLRRRADIETAYHFLSDRQSRRHYDAVREDLLASSTRTKVFAELRRPDLAARITSPSQVDALQIAMMVRERDVVTGHYDQLLQFTRPEQTAALTTVIAAIGAEVEQYYDVILQFKDEHQIQALNLLAPRAGSALSGFLGAAIKINTPERLSTLRRNLTESDADLTTVVRLV